MRVALLPLFMLPVVSPALAQSLAATAGQATKFADPATAVTAPGSGFSSMAQVTVALVVVLAVLFVAAWAMRNFKLFTRSGQTAIEVLQGVNLGPKERAVMIKVHNRHLLLGVAPGCVNLLLELTADEVAADQPPAVSSGQQAAVASELDTPNFKALLKRSMGLS